ncbi:MAG: hypothetical protein QM747_03745 [Nocardioides sp.]
MTRLIDDLNALHDRYLVAVNAAVGADDLDLADALAAEYDEEAITMVAVHEGRTHQLPLRRPRTADSGLRARIRRLTAGRAA